jgi:hypothetical protein
MRSNLSRIRVDSPPHFATQTVMTVMTVVAW